MLHGMCEECARTTWLNDNWVCWRCEKTRGDKVNVNEKEIFIDMIMDLLIIIDLDGITNDKEKEKRVRNELLDVNWNRLNEYYNQANELVEMQHRSETIDGILKEVEEIGVEAVKVKYGIV